MISTGKLQLKLILSLFLKSKISVDISTVLCSMNGTYLKMCEATFLRLDCAMQQPLISWGGGLKFNYQLLFALPKSNTLHVTDPLDSDVFQF